MGFCKGSNCIVIESVQAKTGDSLLGVVQREFPIKWEIELHEHQYPFYLWDARVLFSGIPRESKKTFYPSCLRKFVPYIRKASCTVVFE